MAVKTLTRRWQSRPPKREPGRRTDGFYYLNDAEGVDVGRLPAYSRRVDDEMAIGEVISRDSLRRSTSHDRTK